MTQPEFLAHICDAKAIRAIGTTYKQQVPAEKEDRKLAHLILRDTKGHTIPESTENNKLEDLIAQKIQHDFEHGRTVVVNGWALSQTEACSVRFFHRKPNHTYKPKPFHMHVDARKLPNHSIIEGDICIIGAGAAGISLALEWRNTNKVILLEGGGFDYDDQVHACMPAKPPASVITR